MAAQLDFDTFQGVTMRAYDYEEITVFTTAKGLTSSKLDPGGASPERARAAVIVVASTPVKMRLDGKANPTSSSGIPAAAGDQVSIIGFQNLSQFKAIRSGSSDATLMVTYFK